MVSIAFESLELSGPIDHSATHRRPVIFLALLDGVFAVAMPDALFGQKIVTVGIRNLAAGGRIPRIPIQHEIRSLYSIQDLGSFGPSRCIARHLVFENKNNALLVSLAGSISQLVVDGCPIGRPILESPEVEAPHAISPEGLRHFQRAFQNVVLLMQRKVRSETLGFAE